MDDKDFIIDSVKRITEEISRVRQVLPGNPYLFPPSQNKHNPLLQEPSKLDEILNTDKDTKSCQGNPKLFYWNFPSYCKRNCSSGEKVAFLRLSITFERVRSKDFDPVLLKDEAGRPIDIFPFPYYSMI